MNRERKKVYRKVFAFIVYGYLIKNYSKDFVSSTKHHLVLGSMTSKKCVAVVVRCTGDHFNLVIDLDKKTIKHLGCYQDNKKYPNLELIESALEKFNDELKII